MLMLKKHLSGQSEVNDWKDITMAEMKEFLKSFISCNPNASSP
jgi:hypothetical protein